MNKINYTGKSKILKGISGKINWILDHLISDVKVNGTSVVSDNVASITVPVNTSDLNNDSGFITNTVNNLTNYYLKTDTYTQSEVNDLISAITTIHFQVESDFPQNPEENIIYLIPAQTTEPDNFYEEWIWIVPEVTSEVPHWELIGTTEVDLSNYIQKSSTQGLVKNDGTIDTTQYASMSDIPTVNNATLTIQKNGTNVQTFTANASSNKTANITVPVTQADLTEVRLTNEDLNDVTYPGFYYAAGGNTVTNKPTGYNNFGLVVIHNAAQSQYTQIISNENGSYRRIKKANGTWTSWAEDKFTDTTYTAGTNVSIDANNAISAVDEKVTQTNNTANTPLPILLANSNTDETETSGVKKNLGITFQPSNGALRMARPHTSTTTQDQQIVIGNNIENGTSGSVRGVISLYPKGSAWTKLFASEASESRSYFLPKDRPNNSEIAVTSDLASSNGLGAKNLLPYNTYHKNGYTSNGATFTVNEDGTVTVNRTTTSGTAQFYVTNNTVDGGLWLPNGTYYLSGCPEGGSTGTASGTYQLGVRYVKNNSTVQINDAGDGVSFTIDGSDYSNNGAWVRVVLILRANVSASDMIWKPMIIFDSLADKSFSPPARTNRQLTLDKFDNYNVATKEYWDIIENNYSVGDYMIYKNKLYRVKDDISAGSFLYDNEIALTSIGKDLGNISRWQKKSFTASIGTDLSILDNNVVEFYINIPIQNAGTPIYMSTFISCDEIITLCEKAISYYRTASDNKYFKLSFENDRTTGKIILNIVEVYDNGSAVTSGNYSIEIWYRSFCKY